MNDNVGIKEAAINNIVMDIECYERNIKQILNEIALTYQKMASCTNYNGSQTYSSKVKAIRENSTTIINNLENYKYDLVRVKKLYKQTTTNVVDDITSRANKINVGTQYIRKK